MCDIGEGKGSESWTDSSSGRAAAKIEPLLVDSVNQREVEPAASVAAAALPGGCGNLKK